MDVLSLLENKNRSLERFLASSEEFFPLAEKGDFTSLEAFHSRREAILRTLDLCDRKIAEVIALMPASERNPSLIQSVERALADKEAIIHKILAIDDKIMQKIEDEKNKVLKELNASQKNSAMMKKFKSNWVAESGEGLDQKL